MEFIPESFRHGLDHVSDTDEIWNEVRSVLRSISREDVIKKQIQNIEKWRFGKKTGKNFYKPPVGAQDVINNVIEEKFKNIPGWESQVYVLKDEKNVSKGEKVPYWTMDFRKEKFGVEISFNNAGVLAQNLLRLSVMSESKSIDPSKTIKLGILIVSTQSLKDWGSMDSTVLTFEKVLEVLPHVTFSIPTSIIVLGVNNSDYGVEWAPTKLFGTKKKDMPPYEKLSKEEKFFWNSEVEKELSTFLKL